MVGATYDRWITVGASSDGVSNESDRFSTGALPCNQTIWKMKKKNENLECCFVCNTYFISLFLVLFGWN